MLTGMKERRVGEQGLFGARVGWLSRVLGRGICTWSWGSQGAMDGRQVLIMCWWQWEAEVEAEEVDGRDAH